MDSFTATDAKNRFGVLLDRARREPVAITKQGRQVAVVLSNEDYAHLQEVERRMLRAEIAAGIESGDAGELDIEGIIERVRARRRAAE